MTTRLAPGDAAPDFSLTDDHGQTVSLADFNNDGRDDVILQSTRASGANQPQPIAYLSVNSNPSGLARNAVTLNLDAARDWRFADINNDSRTDAT